MIEMPLLELSGLHKKFGGLSALNGVDAVIEAGKLTAIIGPNGAGKTTLFNVITGLLSATSGRVKFLGERIDTQSVHKISQLGLARTLQIKSVFDQMSVHENLWIAAQTRHGVFKPFTRVLSCKKARETADRLCEDLNLTSLAHQKAGDLSYGDVALLEIGIALATEPKLLLLDEPICGMGPAETARTVETIKALSKQIDIILIEHDMAVVFDISDEIIVMAQGRVLARGTPQEIAADKEVQLAYLGDDDDV